MSKQHYPHPGEAKHYREKCERVWAILQEWHAAKDYQKIAEAESVIETLNGSRFVLAEQAFSPRSRE